MKPLQAPQPGVRRPYTRPMRGWWRRNAFFRIYMLRELTSLAVMAYAIVLTVGLVRLSQGPQAWQSFMDAVASPLGVLLHVVLLLSMVIHAKSWFEIMPKTMPMMFVGGRRVAAATITGLGWAASIIATVAVLIWIGAIA